MSLKHQNSGKWAKSKAIMAKYDLEVRHHQGERRYGIGGNKGKAVHKDASRSRVGEKNHVDEWKTRNLKRHQKISKAERKMTRNKVEKER